MTPTFQINQLVTDPQTNKTGKVIALCNGPHPDRLHLPPKGTPLVQLLGDKPQPPAYWPNAQPLVWLQTYLGKQLRIPECNQDVITLEETAAVLSRICRFGARTWPLNNFYSVAEHSVRVADGIKLLGGADQDQWEGINHEGDEAILGFDPPSPLVRPMRELLSLRATVNNVSGAPHPHVRLESRMEDKPFSLRINRDFAKRLGKVMLAEIELQAKVQRNADGHIESGRMIEFEPVSSRDETVTAWTEWYKANASEWDKVEDIEGELKGRLN